MYLDDIVYFSKTFDEHLTQLWDILKTMEKYKFKLNPEKPKFICKEIKFLG